MIKYTLYRAGDVRYSYATSGGTSATAEGFGYALIRTMGVITTSSQRCTTVDLNLYSTERAKSEDGIWHHPKKNQLLSMDGDDIIGYTYSDGGVAWIKTSPPKRSRYRFLQKSSIIDTHMRVGQGFGQQSKTCTAKSITRENLIANPAN